jgi:fluoride exporter
VTRGPLTLHLLLAVALGGAVGGLLRWALGEMVPPSDGFPWTTFGINVTGAFLLALLPAVAAVRARRALAVALGPGVLGGFTTFSAYAEETRALLADARPGPATAYLFGTLVACLTAVLLAHRLSTPAEQQAFEDEEGNE